MNQLIPGFKFVLEHSLTRREVNVFMYFVYNKLATLLEISKRMNVNPKTVHKVIMTLRLKGLIEIAEKDSKGVHTYQAKRDKDGNIQ